jgi:hypothetical protein
LPAVINMLLREKRIRTGSFVYKKGKAQSAYVSELFLLVFPSGFEPLAYRLGGDRSILLSYGNDSIRILFFRTANDYTVFSNIEQLKCTV